jgi:aryl-alcohol dehydrogenase-like predicted oxidoreductase
MFPGSASPAGSAQYAGRFPHRTANRFYREALGLQLSSLGIGTYLGALDEETSKRYRHALITAVQQGINVIDTSLNYRRQQSERDIGCALEELFTHQFASRDELLLCTKAGYLVPGAIPPNLPPDAVVAGQHSLAPTFLEDQLERSRRNLNCQTIDVYYLHNPETQLGHVQPEEFYRRIGEAFLLLERLVEQGRIRWYGAATWNGFREAKMSLVRMEALARQIAGPQHHFRFIQFPYNLAMTEAFTRQTEEINGQPLSLLEAAGRLGIVAVASASLLQARLCRNLPQPVRSALGLQTDAQCALQFTRSAPGLTTALVGMSQPEHVLENLRVAEVPPLDKQSYRRLFA